MKTSKLLTIIFKGLLVYTGMVIFWGTLICIAGGAKYNSTGDQVSNWWDCIYFSCISFATIGYGDIIPNGSSGQVIIFLQSMTAMVFVGLFGGFVAYQFLKRPKDIFLTDNLHIRYVDNEIFFSSRVGNKGKELIDCVAYIDLIQIKNDIKWTMIKHEVRYSLLEKSWFLGIKISSNSNPDFLKAFRKLFNNPEKSLIRILVTGSDIESGEIVATSKYYKVNDIKFGGRYLDIYHWKKLKRTEPNWDNLNKTQEITPEQQQEINSLIQTKLDNDNDDYIAGCSNG